MPIDGASVLDDRYALDQLIGRGGMADVYRGTDLVLGRPVAVKVLRVVTADAADRARFAAEARTLAQLSHAALVTVLDAGTAGDQPFLVMELIDGPSLAECCEGTALDPARVASFGAQVADALGYAHAADVVHRDVKPGNVLLGSDGRARLTDFGIARLMGDTARHTGTGLLLGSPAYLSPEQVRGWDVTAATDVYSLGLVLLEALTGKRAYRGSPTEAALARLATPPPIPETLPEGWRRLLDAMTTLEPAERPTAEQLALALGPLTGDPGTEGSRPSADSEDAVSTRVMSTPRHRRGPLAAETGQVPRGSAAGRMGRTLRRRWITGAALAVLVLVVLTAVLVDRGSRDGGGPGRRERVQPPADVPSRLQQPLQDLHDAVNGSNQ